MNLKLINAETFIDDNHKAWGSERYYLNITINGGGDYDRCNMEEYSFWTLSDVTDYIHNQYIEDISAYAEDIEIEIRQVHT